MRRVAVIVIVNVILIVIVLSACSSPMPAPASALPHPSSTASPPLQPIDAASDTPSDTSVAARAVIDEAVIAKGGRARLAAVKSLRYRGTGKVIGNMTFELQDERLIILPTTLQLDRHGRTASGHNSHSASLVIGEQGWRRSESDQSFTDAKTINYSRDEIAATRLEIWHEHELLLLRASDPTAKLATAPDEIIAGIPCAVVTLVGPNNGTIGLYIDKARHLLVRSTYVDRIGLWTVDASDFTKVDGLVFGQARTWLSGSTRTELVYLSIEVNPKIHAGDLRPPM